MKLKKIIAALAAVALISSLSMNVFAGQWKQVPTGYHQMGYIYENSDGTRVTNGWQWIDGKCYYFDEIGTMLANTTTPDGYTVDGSGAWTVDGVVQTQAVETKEKMPYDPVHPLANKIDEWNLKITPNKYSDYICNNNVQAMLTNQMDQYYRSPVGYSTDSAGNSIYTSETAYTNNMKYDQDLYNWYCNWLNGMDFESMSEMDKAKEIQKVLASCTYDDDYANNPSSYNSRFGYDYAVLINRKGICSEFTMTARSLAKSMGLKSGMGGNANHSWYYIQADGKIYSGENQYLNLNAPTSDYAYVD